MTDPVVVGGSPLVALIAALYALRLFPDVRVLLLEATRTEEAEVFRPHRLPWELQALIDTLIVQRWDRYQTFMGGEGREFEESLALVDPVQCRIELDNFADRITFRSVAPRERMSDLPVGSQPARMLHAPFAEKLAIPVLFARDAEYPDRYLQCFPLGGGMTIVRERHLRPASDALEACFAWETALVTACSAMDARQNPPLMIELRVEHC